MGVALQFARRASLNTEIRFGNCLVSRLYRKPV